MLELEQLRSSRDQWTSESICTMVAEMFQVKGTEVALLELRGKLLHFLFPEELRTAGAIPISSSAVAARTASERKSEIFNTFAQIHHCSVFELVKLGDSGLDSQVIQKLMSAPILDSGDAVLGVIQISRKGPRPAIAGPDFTTADLTKLESVARIIVPFLAKRKAMA